MLSPTLTTGIIVISIAILPQFIFVVGDGASPKNCKKGWSPLSLADNGTYTEGPVCVKIISKKSTFLKAAEQCRQDGGELATILSEEYQTAVQKMIKTEKHWIGLSDFSIEGSFAWVSGHPSVPTVFWAKDQPNDGMGHQDCIAIDPSKQSNESWFDEHCTESLPFVCMTAKFKAAPSSIVLKTENGTCPKEFFRLGNRCMKIITDKLLTQSEARKQCQKQKPNGDLASIYTIEEQNVLTAMMLNKSAAVWIGLYLNTETHTRMWVRGFHVATFTNWKNREPNGLYSQSNIYEPCVMMYKRSSSPGEWNDKACDTKLGYVCGVDLKPGENDKNEVVPFTSKGKCQDGEVEFDSYCYKSPDKEFSSYNEADEACQKLHKLGHLTTPHNAYDIAFTSILMHHLKINHTLLGFQIKYVEPEFQIITADKSSDIGFESLKGLLYSNVNDIACIESTGDPQHTVSVTNCSRDIPFKALCSYPLETNAFHPTNNKFTCKNGWTAITGGRCIKDFHEEKNMLQANNACKAKSNGSLVSILNVHDQQSVFKISKDPVWIGLEVSIVSPNKSASFRWVDDKPVVYLNWRTGEPSPRSKSGDEEGCVILRHKTADWNNVACEKQYGYVCSMPGIEAGAPTTVTPSTSSTMTPKPTPTPTLKPTTKPTPTTTASKPTTKPKPTCPSGFTKGPSDNCYKLIKKSTTWHEAEKDCNQMSKGHLVSIHKELEHHFINSFINQSKISSAWIGLTDLYGPVENQFSYWSDHSPLTIMFMNPHTDANYVFGDQECVVFTVNSKGSSGASGVWNMKHCTTRAPGFICMVTLNKKPIPTPPKSKHIGNYCSSGFLKFNNTCYKLIKQPETFREATRKCRLLLNKRRATLTRINNVETNDFLLSLLSPIKNSNAWIGMHHENGEFHWNDNWPVHFTKWPVNMTATDKKMTCVTLGASTLSISSGFWIARNCHEKFPYLCEAPLLENDPPKEPSKCKGKYTLYPDGNTCYRRLESPTTFKEGMKQCKADQKILGLKTAPALLSIDNIFEMSFFRAWMMESGAPLDRSVWIGLKLEKNNPVWEWTTGEPVSFTYSSGFPDDISGCYYTYVHRKILKDELSTNVYGMQPDSGCLDGEGGKRTTVCKYSLEPKAIVQKPKNCLDTQNGTSYAGHRAVTKSGKACVRWDMLNDVHVLVQLHQKIGGSDSNFCRNPIGKGHQKGRPYCYTTRGKTTEPPIWEFCDIPLCSTAFTGHVGNHSYVVAVAILVIVLLVTISFFVGVMLWRRTNTARGFIPYLRQHDPEGGTSFHNPIYTPAANC